MSAGNDARSLLLDNYQGILATNSLEMPGYPFGSVVPYCLDKNGQPIILISQIAQHTKNILADPKVSLITVERNNEDIQVGGRLTCLADVIALQGDEQEAAADRYYRYFPNSRDYHNVHDFDFYRLQLVRARYIGGFGKIHWIAPEKMLLANPFSAAEELSMISHMNDDHIKAMLGYCSKAGIDTADHIPAMAGIDSEGFHLRLGDRIIRFNFDQTATSVEAIRTQLVAMAKSE